MSPLCSLPSELFSLIFGATRGSISDEALQLVCRRFRYHALDTPSFWVDICDEMPSEHISQRLERCGELQLYLTVSHGLPGRNQQCKCTKWEIIKRHDTSSASTVTLPQLTRAFRLDFTIWTQSFKPSAVRLPCGQMETAGRRPGC